METKVPCSLLLPHAVISFSLYEPFSEPEMELWDFPVLSTSKWWISSWCKCCECQAETAPTIVIIWGYLDQIHLHQPHSAGEMKILYLHFPRVFFTFFLLCWTHEKKQNFKKGKVNQWHKQSQRMEFLAKNVTIFGGLFLLLWDVHIFMPQNVCRFCVDNTLPWHLAATAGPKPAG